MITQSTSPKRNSASRFLGLVLLALVWLSFVVWQFGEHRRQCELIQATLVSKAETLIDAVNSGVRSHRWFGPFVQQRLPGTLDVLARPSDVVAIAIVVNEDRQDPFVAGDASQIDYSLGAGEHQREGLLQVVSTFEMRNEPPMMRGIPAGSDSSAAMSRMKSIVLLDRTQTINQINHEIRNRVLIVAMGTLLIVAIAFFWQFTVRVARAEGQARLLSAETRHLRELGQAAAGLAHETRNPLGLIRGWTQRMVDAGLPEGAQKEQAEAVLEECDRVTARINQFLAFARPADVNSEPIAVDEMMEELTMLLQSDLDQRQLRLVHEGSNAATRVLADRSQLRQVLFNLLSNAIALAPEGSVIQTRLVASGRGTYRLEVMDQGPGVPAEIVDSLFEPYVSRRPGGTGLGLSIVRRIAIAHDWEVGYKSGDDGGSVFWIEGIRAPSSTSSDREGSTEAK